MSGKTIEYLFLDLDDTILDFQKAERIALSKTLETFGLEPEEEILHRYHLVNKAHWEMLERRELTRPEVLVNRFAVLFREFDLEVDAPACAKVYEKNLSVGHYFLPGALEAVQALHGRYRLFLASNGTASVQHSRLASADLYRYFEQVFISQEIGFDKPAPGFFAACRDRIPGFAPQRAVMVGDSLTSDILGGRNGGMTTVWVNPGHKDCGSIRPDYQIEHLAQLESLLDRLRKEGQHG